MIRICETITTDDGRQWVSLEDYQKLLGEYEKAIDTINGDCNIAELGEDEVVEYE